MHCITSLLKPHERFMKESHKSPPLLAAGLPLIPNPTGLCLISKHMVPV